MPQHACDHVGILHVIMWECHNKPAHVILHVIMWECYNKPDAVLWSCASPLSTPDCIGVCVVVVLRMCNNRHVEC